MDLNKIKKIYFCFILLIIIVLGILLYLDDKAQKDIISELNEKYNVDESKGDILVQCDDGTYDVYNQYNSSQNMVCGLFIS